MYNVNVYVNTFAFSFKLILGENTFFMKYPWATASNNSESFLKILQKTPLKLEESLFFNDVADSIQSQALCNLN